MNAQREAAPTKRAQPPKYREITSVLRDELRSQAIGTQLAPERELAERFSVSRMTLRQALDELEAEGRIARVRGSGSFVRRPTVAMGPTLTSFTEDMRTRGLQPSSRLLGFERIDSGTASGEMLAEVTDEVIRIERLRLADDEPMCIEVALFPVHLQRMLESGDLEKSVHAILRAGGIELTSLDRRVRAVAAGPRESRLLGLPEGAPALEVFDIFRDSSGLTVQWARSRYRADRYEVMTRTNRIDNDRGDSAVRHQRTTAPQ
ncbi:GntR family transcriptional regulator [Terrabacter terrigena]|uniref:GntR family transcriptional regulator n=1 Tax=Terrabacter terrigena TaxID=574718 RepID=A0ABW3N498_9MICO